MKQSHVCLEPSWAHQLNFLIKFKEEVLKIFNKIVYGIEPEIDSDCDGEAFLKVKYSSSDSNYVPYSESNEIAMTTDIITGEPKPAEHVLKTLMEI